MEKLDPKHEISLFWWRKTAFAVKINKKWGKKGKFFKNNWILFFLCYVYFFGKSTNSTKSHKLFHEFHEMFHEFHEIPRNVPRIPRNPTKCSTNSTKSHEMFHEIPRNASRIPRCVPRNEFDQKMAKNEFSEFFAFFDFFWLRRAHFVIFSLFFSGIFGRNEQISALNACFALRRCILHEIRPHHGFFQLAINFRLLRPNLVIFFSSGGSVCRKFGLTGAFCARVCRIYSHLQQKTWLFAAIF